MNTIQYISTTHTSKDEAEKNKKKVNILHNLYLKEDSSFEEIALLHGSGSTIGRVGDTTDFLAIDIDETTVPISTVQAHFEGNPDYHVALSSSKDKDGLKYHILVNLNRTITRDDYKAEVELEFDNIKSQLCTNNDDKMILDENADNFYQCFFGTSAEISTEIILDGSKRLWSWVKKDITPRFYIDREQKVYPTLNSGDYCRRNNLLTIPGKRFDIYTPHMTNGRWKKIAVGKRFGWGRLVGTQLLMRIFYLNHDFGEGWTKEHLLDTFAWIMSKNVIMYGSFKRDFDVLKGYLGERWEELKNMPYSEQCRQLEPYFKCSQRQYKSRKYKPQVMSELIMEHQIDEENVLFLNKEELKSICEEKMLNCYEFVKYVESLGLKVVYEEVLPDKRQKHFVEDMTLEEFNKYCKDKGLSRGMKCKLKKKLIIK